MFECTLERFSHYEFQKTRQFLAEVANCTFRAKHILGIVVVLCLRFFNIHSTSNTINESMENIFTKIFSSFKLPVVRAEDELVDPQVVLREECTRGHCAELQKKYEECNIRVNSKKKTAETCEEELFDFMGCVDHCVAKTLFSKLK